MTMTTLIQNEQKRQKIMARMREHLVPVLEHCRLTNASNPSPQVQKKGTSLIFP